MNAPHGINLTRNMSVLLPGDHPLPGHAAGWPAGQPHGPAHPGFPFSTASLFRVLRRWAASPGAAALGGALYGFSPARLTASIGHYHLQFAVLPPLIVDPLLRILTGRGRALRNGSGLGLLAAAQLFTSAELLAMTVPSGAVTWCLVACWPAAVRYRVAGAAAGLAAAATVLLVTCAIRSGSSSMARWPARQPVPGQLVPHLPAHVRHPVRELLLHTSGTAAAAARYPARPARVPRLPGLATDDRADRAAIGFWRQLRSGSRCSPSRCCSILPRRPARLAALALAGPPLPVLSEMLPNRFALLADGAAAALLAFGLDQARPTVRDRGWRGWRAWIPAVVAVTAVLPLLPLPLPVTTAAAVLVAGQTAFSLLLRLAPDAPVLVVPVPYEEAAQALRWQADTGQPGSLVGGWFIGPDATRHAALYGGSQTKRAAKHLNSLLTPTSLGRPHRPRRRSAPTWPGGGPPPWSRSPGRRPRRPAC